MVSVTFFKVYPRRRLASPSISVYSGGTMFPVIEFNKAAFKHDVTETNIRYALRHPLYEELLESYKNKWRK